MRALVAALALLCCAPALANGVPYLVGVAISGQHAMPLGDSITRGVGDVSSDAYRYQFYLDVLGAGYTIQFVGSQTWGTDLPVGQQANEGHGGYTIADIAAELDGWIAAQPSMTVVYLNAGINDVLTFSDLEHFGVHYAALLDQIHTDCPGCIVYDINMLPVADAGVLLSLVTVLNLEIKSACYHRIYCRFVDANSALTWPGDFNDDGVHPLKAGYVKEANALFNAARAYQTAVLQPY